MVRRLIEGLKTPAKIDDKDHYGNKRLDCAGQLMALLFEDTLKRFNSEWKKELEKRVPQQKNKNVRFYDVSADVHTKTFTISLESALSSGSPNLNE
jgi:DNA-directed RNA polymerase III subunit RPC2